METLTFYKSFYEAIKNLNEEQRLKLYDAIFEYQFEQKNTTFDDVILNSLWLLIRPNIDASNSKKLAGGKGGRPKKNKSKPSFSKNKNLAFQNSKSNEEVEVKEEVDVEVDEEVKEKENADAKEVLSPATEKNNAFDFYFNNINSLPTIHEIEQLKDYQKELSDELICYAIEIAVENKRRNLAYVKGILNSWISKGINTIQEAKDEKKKHEEGNFDKEHEDMWAKLAEQNKDWKG